MKRLKYKKGFAGLYITVMVTVIVLGIVVTLTAIVLGQQKITKNIVVSAQAYYAAEAGAEDALLRLVNGMNIPDSYEIVIEDSTSSVEIVSISGSRTITVEGNKESRIKKVEIVFSIDANSVNFHYGVQSGDLGVQMDSNARIHGNLFSNGQIIGSSNNLIYGDTVSAGDNGLISNVIIVDDEGGGNAWAKTLEDSNIDGDAHYTNIDNCNVGGTHYAPEAPIGGEGLPISAAQLLGWKDDAVAGGTTTSYTLDGGSSDSLGPIKIDGNMVVDGNAALTVAGTIWVTGDLIFLSNTTIELDDVYGARSGIIIVDGTIFLDSNVVICGAEGYEKKGKCNPSIGSYLMLLSTKNAPDAANPAISATSNTNSAILYASDGFVSLNSNASLKEVTGRGIYMASNAVVTYETGLASTLFSSGPSGGWNVVSWKEIP